MGRKRVLFLCTGNSCRSQMAEGWLRALGGDRFEVFSAGIEAHGLNARAVAVMREVGVDISHQKSAVLDSKLLGTLDLLITVCSHADEHCPAVPVSCQKDHWPFDDPARAIGTEEEVLATFRRVRDQIRDRILVFLHSEEVCND